MIPLEEDDYVEKPPGRTAREEPAKPTVPLNKNTTKEEKDNSLITVIGGKKPQKRKKTMHIDLRPEVSNSIGNKNFNSILADELPAFCKELRDNHEEFEGLDDSKIARIFIVIGINYLKSRFKK